MVSECEHIDVRRLKRRRAQVCVHTCAGRERSHAQNGDSQSHLPPVGRRVYRALSCLDFCIPYARFLRVDCFSISYRI